MPLEPGGIAGRAASEVGKPQPNKGPYKTGLPNQCPAEAPINVGPKRHGPLVSTHKVDVITLSVIKFSLAKRRYYIFVWLLLNAFQHKLALQNMASNTFSVLIFL